jgi:hypothetical protein
VGEPDMGFDEIEELGHALGRIERRAITAATSAVCSAALKAITFATTATSPLMMSRMVVSRQTQSSRRRYNVRSHRRYLDH